MTHLSQDQMVRLSEKQLRKEKARSLAMRLNLRRRKLYQQALKAKQNESPQPLETE